MATLHWYIWVCHVHIKIQHYVRKITSNLWSFTVCTIQKLKLLFTSTSNSLLKEHHVTLLSLLFWLKQFGYLKLKWATSIETHFPLPSIQFSFFFFLDSTYHSARQTCFYLLNFCSAYTTLNWGRGGGRGIRKLMLGANKIEVLQYSKSVLITLVTHCSLQFSFSTHSIAWS